mmetsp:Transcript_43048/g.125188  ORF Transcript_43048/g.125188 Transcript_43048/m.125188 type:complete len:380 (-) Transcript_43048:82-1221(-)
MLPHPLGAASCGRQRPRCAVRDGIVRGAALRFRGMRARTAGSPLRPQCRERRGGDSFVPGRAACPGVDRVHVAGAWCGRTPHQQDLQDGPVPRDGLEVRLLAVGPRLRRGRPRLPPADGALRSLCCRARRGRQVAPPAEGGGRRPRHRRAVAAPCGHRRPDPAAVGGRQRGRGCRGYAQPVDAATVRSGPRRCGCRFRSVVGRRGCSALRRAATNRPAPRGEGRPVAGREHLGARGEPRGFLGARPRAGRRPRGPARGPERRAAAACSAIPLQGGQALRRGLQAKVRQNGSRNEAEIRLRVRGPDDEGAAPLRDPRVRRCGRALGGAVPLGVPEGAGRGDHLRARAFVGRAGGEPVARQAPAVTRPTGPSPAQAHLLRG